mmetsp:Transcript_42021/g.59030  ORF Transcript_42021/g.59030 Transcript_42021/m.59030 type:complete len:109 (-) Transcript_42021:420-746(-)
MTSFTGAHAVQAISGCVLRIGRFLAEGPSEDMASTTYVLVPELPLELAAKKTTKNKADVCKQFAKEDRNSQKKGVHTHQDVVYCHKDSNEEACEDQRTFLHMFCCMEE